MPVRRQLTFPIEDSNFSGQGPLGREPDRNLHLGGRSFYFFDFDDNIATLQSPTYLYHLETGEEISVTSRQFAEILPRLGKDGPWRDYKLNWDDVKGSFRSFRDHEPEVLQSMGRRDQVFVEDLAHALGLGEERWQGPSWKCFVHATLNQRPVSIITARGHNPETIKKGIELWVESEHLPHAPHYHTVFPVHHHQTRLDLGDAEMKLSTAELKKAAIRCSVLEAFAKYSQNDHHQFGMSDDDPTNLKMIFEEMHDLKKEFPRNRFFVFETRNQSFIKHEILLESERSQIWTGLEQLSFAFDLEDPNSNE